ncbi:U-box domain-containing protein 44-like protein [Tanacetum coccineum]
MILSFSSDAKQLLENLSFLHENSVQENRVKIIKHGASEILFGILFRDTLSIPTLVEKVVGTIMNLALSLNLCESDHGEVPFLESEEDVFKSFSLISLNRPNVQQNVLRTFIALCQSSSGLNIRNTLRKMTAMEIISNLPKDPQMTRGILDAGALQVIISILSNRFQKTKLMIDSASGALCRFTDSTIRWRGSTGYGSDPVWRL